MSDDLELDPHPAHDDTALRSAMDAVSAEPSATRPDSGAARWAPAAGLLVETADPDRRSSRVIALAGTTVPGESARDDAGAAGPGYDPDTPTWADSWCEADPSADAHAVLAHSYVQRAWAVRGSTYADGVQTDAWSTYYRLLSIAQGHAEEAVRLAPQDPTSYATKILLATALGEDRGEFEHRLAATLERHRWHLDAHRFGLMYLMQKWHGSHEEMYAFAHATAMAAPDGSALHNLPVEAHAEWDLAETSVSGRFRLFKAVAATGRSIRHWSSERVRADCDRALERWVRWPTGPAGARYSELNFLAYALIQATRPAEAAEVFAAIGPAYTQLPWVWKDGDDPEGAFVSSRAEARAAPAGES